MGMPGLHLVGQQVQSQSLSPRLQRAVKLLQMSSLDYAQELTEALAQNPFLADESEDEPAMPPALEVLANPLLASETASKTKDGEVQERPTGEDDGDRAKTDETPAEAVDWSDVSPAQKDSGSLTAVDLMVARTGGLADHLHRQIRLLRLSERQSALAHAIVDLLEEDGYLRADAELLTAPEWLDPPATSVEVNAALGTVQSLDPLGVGARSLEECLLLQVPTMQDPDLERLATQIISGHLRLLANRDLNNLMRHVQASARDVEKICAAIRSFDPRPGLQYSSTEVQYIVPDVIARRHRGRWIAVLNSSVVPRMHLNQRLLELYHSHKKACSELREHMTEARWLVGNIEQRFCTIVAVAQAILDRQTNFLNYGEMGLKPLSLSEIATTVGVHESTVSRVTCNKYIATPCGMYELRHFFSRAMVMPSGAELSGKAIRSLLRDMIAEEPADQPLTDNDIAKMLAKQGLKLARRTVTKYRQAMRIAPANLRKEQPA